MSENTTGRAIPMREVIAEEIRVLLARRRMSASELARQMGVTQPYISRRLTGEIAFDVDDLENIANVLQVQPKDLLSPVRAVPTSQYVRTGQDRHMSPVRLHPPARADAATRPPNRPAGPKRPALLRGNQIG